MQLRKLNSAGIDQFAEYIRNGADGEPPRDLLQRPETSEPVQKNVDLPEDLDALPDRYVFGNRLVDLLKGFDPSEISNDRGLWSGLALLWFDHMCPKKAEGKRTISKEYHYILSEDYRHYYRHLVRSPWQLVRNHGKNARFLLISPRKSTHPLSVHGEILEQFGGRQQVLASCEIITAASKMYFDGEKTGQKQVWREVVLEVLGDSDWYSGSST